MKRILSSLAMLGLIASTATQAAKPVTCYDAYVVEVPQKYAIQGSYWGLNLGGNFIVATNTNLTLFNDSNPNANPGNIGISLPSIKQSYQGGEYLALTLGYRACWFRFEGELGYRHSKVSKTHGLFEVLNNTTSPPTTQTLYAPTLKQGSTDLGTLMLNFYYDRYYTSGWLWSIGLGLGYGATYYDANLTEFGDKVQLPQGFIDFSGYSGSFAGQLIFGIGYRWNDNVETALTYRALFRTRSHYTVDNVFLNGWRVEFSPEYLTNTIAFEFRFF